MRILITGTNGQLGTDLRHTLKGHDLIACTHADLDVTDRETVTQMMAQHRPDVVINTAAYHKVDECESFPEKTFAVNALGPRNLAQACQEQAATLVHVSTNFVFDGQATQPYTEEDIPAPLSVYGAAKHAGEHLVRALCDQHLVIRTTGLYGVAGSGGVGKGMNFIELMIKLGRERGAVTIVDDQIMTPTSTIDLAETIGRLIQMQAYGTYHITNSGACSYYEFATTIFQKVGLTVDAQATTTEAYGAPAQRPLYSVLDNSRLHQLGITPLRLWDEALDAYLLTRQHV